MAKWQLEQLGKHPKRRITLVRDGEYIWSCDWLYPILRRPHLHLLYLVILDNREEWEPSALEILCSVLQEHEVRPALELLSLIAAERLMQ